jgi:hypothetical protein
MRRQAPFPPRPMPQSATVPSLPAPPALSSGEDELALRFLEARRGRRIQQAPPTLSALIERQMTKAEAGASGAAGAARRMAASLSRIKLRWPQIVGEKLAGVCQPEALRKDTLVLRTTSAAAPLLQMRATELLGLVALAGGPPLKKLAFVRAPLSAIGPPPRRRAPRPLPAAAAAELEERMAPLDDARLKEAIRTLATVLAQD